MKTYLSLIKLTQLILLGISIIVLAILPGLLVLYPDSLDISWLYFIAHTSLFLVMVIRPLSDVASGARFIRPLVILRKGVGVLSASFIVSFIISKIIIDPVGYFTGFTQASYWSINNLALFAHLADISAILLLVTSNNYSKRLLGANWKRLQRLSYVYFYGSGIYVVYVLKDYLVLSYLIIVTALTLVAFGVNKARRELQAQKIKHETN